MTIKENDIITALSNFEFFDILENYYSSIN